MSSSQRSRKAKFSRSSAFPFTAKGFNRALALSAFLLSAGSAPAAVIGLDQLNASLDAGDAVIASGDQVVLSGDVDNSIRSNGHVISGDGNWRDSPLITHRNDASDVLKITADTLAVKNVKSCKSGSNAYGALYSDVSLDISAAVLDFTNNVASSDNYAYGGAIDASGGEVRLKASEAVTLSGNYALGAGDAYGGAVYAVGNIILDATGGVLTAVNNRAESSYGSAYGGALYNGSDIGLVEISADSIVMTSNTASADQGNAYGGAIYSGGGDEVGSDCSATLTAISGNISFSGNYAASGLAREAKGGAIFSWDSVTLNASSGDISFSKNYAAGDLDYRSAMISGGTAGGEYLSAVSDADNFRAALNLEARRKDFSLGLNVRGQWSSGQHDLGASLTGRWEF